MDISLTYNELGIIASTFAKRKIIFSNNGDNAIKLSIKFLVLPIANLDLRSISVEEQKLTFDISASGMFSSKAVKTLSKTKGIRIKENIMTIDLSHYLPNKLRGFQIQSLEFNPETIETVIEYNE